MTSSCLGFDSLTIAAAIAVATDSSTGSHSFAGNSFALCLRGRGAGFGVLSPESAGLKVGCIGGGLLILSLGFGKMRICRRNLLVDEYSICYYCSF